jgi:hypothetical protein
MAAEDSSAVAEAGTASSMEAAKEDSFGTNNQVRLLTTFAFLFRYLGQLIALLNRSKA